jgi:hypothetical protein
MSACRCSAQGTAKGRQPCKSCAEQNRRRYILTLLRDARHRAKKQGIPFSITPADVNIPDKCPILGIPLIPKPPNGRPGPWIYSPSLDKIVPELGYVPGNIQILSARANTLKSNGSLEELAAIGKFAKRCLRERRSAGLGDRPSAGIRGSRLNKRVFPKTQLA